MMTGEDGKAAMSDLLEFMGLGEAKEYLCIYGGDDGSDEVLSLGEIREKHDISKKDESTEEMDPFEIEEMQLEWSKAEREQYERNSK